MMSVVVDKTQLKRLEQSLGAKANRLPRELKTAVNAVSRKVAAQAAKKLQAKLPLKQATLKKIVKAKPANAQHPMSAVINLGPGYAIPLRLFKPTQLKRGVTVKMQRGQARTIIRDAWIAKQYGNHVYKRLTKERRPIAKQYGPRPGQYYEQLGVFQSARAMVQDELKKQIERRIRFNVLKAQGVI